MQPSSPEERPQPTPKQVFDKTLRSIQDHMFVNEESQKRMAQLRENFPKLQDELKAQRAFEIVMIPFGSVATGMATAESDIDAFVLYNQYSFDDHYIKLNREPRDLGLTDKEKNDIVLGRFDHVVDYNYIRQVVDEVLESQNSAYFMDETRCLPIVFAPTLNEFSDPEEKEAIDYWRRRALMQIKTLFPDQADQVWDFMRDFLKGSFINYERPYDTPEFDIKSEVRAQRVDEQVSQVISNRFPDDPQKQERAKSFIQTKRNSLEYPPFKTMIEAFDVRTF